ncbi:MAG: UDP-3-O-(3-hydroxymyristoyl)glucosamine N-acyltransferase [Ignavibacteriales bacterium]|nr:UDP-3-O-(3-hydroxymyristoyl)glucosamine N-acyltransferase [Ignavibacteriales bacterium]MCB9218528.1 UDP-3-O-(3-hydroxymyristoyl)glucosamine N-acyltransferase [Ignavibacteriales bacterium]
MAIKISEIADLIEGNIVGNTEISIEKLSNIQDAQNGDLTFLYMASYNEHLKNTKASVVLIPPTFEKSNKNVTYIEVEKPNLAFQKIINNYFKPSFSLTGIHNSANIAESAELGENVALGFNVVVEENSIIGSDTKIYHNSVIMGNCKIGSNVLIFPNVTIRENTVIGNNVIIHSGTVIGSDGFGYSPDQNGVYHKIPQIGNVIIEDDVELGSNVSIDRAAVGSTIIHKGVKLDNLVQIAHNVKVGENTVMSAQTGISGSAKIGKNCIFAGQVGSVGHIEIADNVIVGAQSGISKGIKKSGTYFGSPAKEIQTTLKLEAHIRTLPKYAEKIKELERKIAELEKLYKSEN